MVINNPEKLSFCQKTVLELIGLKMRMFKFWNSTFFGPFQLSLSQKL
jgi:hypothetical protein